MPRLAGPTIIEAQDLYKETSTAQHRVGQLAWDEYGSRYRYVKNGAAALTTGNLLQEPAEVTNFRSMNVNTNAAIGTYDIEVTLGGTAVTASMFDGGELVVESSTGIGQHFRIKNHDVQATTTGTCTFTVDRPIKIALVKDASQVSVRKNSYNGVIQSPVTTLTGVIVGVALYAMTASYYGWIVSGGDCAVLMDAGTNTANDQQNILPSVGTAGSAEGAGTGATIGYCKEVASTDSTMNFVHLIID
jgi:hypothetical protein